MSGYWRIAIASLDAVSVSEHFGRAKYFYIVDIFPDGTTISHGKREVKPLCGSCNHIDSGLAAEISSISDCCAVLVERIGPSARKLLELAKISVFEQVDFIDEAVQKLAAYFVRTKTPVSGGLQENGQET